MNNSINWFDIPAVDFQRAVTFYETIFGVTLHQEALGGTMNGIFPADEQGITGAVCQGEGYAPSADGAIVYLNANGKLDDILSRVEVAGGKVLRPEVGDWRLWAYRLADRQRRQSGWLASVSNRVKRLCKGRFQICPILSAD